MASFTTTEAENCSVKEANFNVEKPSSSADTPHEYNGVVKETNMGSDDEDVIYNVDPISVYFPTTTAVPSNPLKIRKQRTLKESVLVGTSSKTITHSELGHTGTEFVEEKMLEGWIEEERMRKTGKTDKFFRHESSTKQFRSMVQVVKFIKSKSYQTKKNKGTLEDSHETSTPNNSTPPHGHEDNEYKLEALKHLDKFEDFEGYFNKEEPAAADSRTNC